MMFRSPKILTQYRRDPIRRCLECNTRIAIGAKYERHDVEVSVMRGEDHVLFFCEQHTGQKLTDEQLLQMESDRKAKGAAEQRARDAAPALLQELMGLVEEIAGLIDESDGVYGLHLNGDVSPWGELVQGGRFERLLHIQSAIELINKVTGK